MRTVGKYELGRTIGEGSFGKVKAAIDTTTGRQVAIKILNKDAIEAQKMLTQIRQEISIMKLVRHDNIVRLYEVLASKSRIFIVLELVTGGELFDKIVEAGRFSDLVALRYFRQLLAGVDYCHSQGICHRDLKPENLLLDADGTLKITDFGLSTLHLIDGDPSSTRLLRTTCGTPNYVAPEVLADRGYDGRKADMWSCGVILYVLLAGYLPFDEPTSSALFQKIQRADFQYPKWFSSSVRDLLDHLLVPDPRQRYGIRQIKAHPWMHQEDGLNGRTGSSAAAAAAGRQTGSESSSVQPQADPADLVAAAAAAAAAKSAAGAVSSLAAGFAKLSIVPPSPPASPRPEPIRVGEQELEQSIQLTDESGGDLGCDTPMACRSCSDMTAPPRLDAFALIALCGGLGLESLFASGGESSSSGGSGSGTAGGPAAPATGGGGGGRTHHFGTRLPADHVMQEISSALAATQMDISAPESSPFRLRGVSAALGISAVFQLYQLAPSLLLVEVRRGKGDILAYKAWHNDLMGSKLAHVVVGVGGGESAESPASRSRCRN